VVWVYRDIRNRTTDQGSQLIAVILVAVFNVPGLVVYLVIRPQTTLADAYERSLEAEAILHELQLTANACQSCRRPIEDDFNVCPHCRVVLREPCRNCGKSVRTSWATCPYCATERIPSRMQPAPTSTLTGDGGLPPRRTTTAQQPQRRPQPVASQEDAGLPRRPTAPSQVD
jgi:RNA polymerase subunit RPABC4/transcription elongation factor Spt4